LNYIFKELSDGLNVADEPRLFGGFC
jgi:hypothetical protein